MKSTAAPAGPMSVTIVDPRLEAKSRYFGRAALPVVLGLHRLQRRERLTGVERAVRGDRDAARGEEGRSELFVIAPPAPVVER